MRAASLRVGELRRLPHGVAFTYDPDWKGPRREHAARGERGHDGDAGRRSSLLRRAAARRTPPDIGRASLIALGAAVGLPRRATERVLDEIVDAVPSWFDDLGVLPYDERRIHKLGRAIRHRVERLRRR